MKISKEKVLKLNWQQLEIVVALEYANVLCCLDANLKQDQSIKWKAWPDWRIECISNNKTYLVPMILDNTDKTVCIIEEIMK